MKFSGKSLVVAATAGAILSGSVLAAEVTEATSEKHAAAATQY
ncbi:cytochrome c, partial [Alteromonadaceae bacterium A_SAG6]|nr:cytochrome c [Alteromonadaceae bacterium A_SAG6]